MRLCLNSRCNPNAHDAGCYGPLFVDESVAEKAAPMHHADRCDLIQEFSTSRSFLCTHACTHAHIVLQVRNLSARSPAAGARPGLQLVCLCNKPSVEFLALQVSRGSGRRVGRVGKAGRDQKGWRERPGREGGK